VGVEVNPTRPEYDYIGFMYKGLYRYTRLYTAPPVTVIPDYEFGDGTGVGEEDNYTWSLALIPWGEYCSTTLNSTAFPALPGFSDVVDCEHAKLCEKAGKEAWAFANTAEKANTAYLIAFFLGNILVVKVFSFKLMKQWENVGLVIIALNAIFWVSALGYTLLSLLQEKESFSGCYKPLDAYIADLNGSSTYQADNDQKDFPLGTLGNQSLWMGYLGFDFFFFLVYSYLLLVHNATLRNICDYIRKPTYPTQGLLSSICASSPTILQKEIAGYSPEAISKAPDTLFDHVSLLRDANTEHHYSLSLIELACIIHENHIEDDKPETHLNNSLEVIQILLRVCGGSKTDTSFNDRAEQLMREYAHIVEEAAAATATDGDGADASDITVFELDENYVKV
jgi:hypothetical protein